MISLFAILIPLLQFVNFHPVKADVDANCGYVYGRPTSIACREAINTFHDRGDGKTHFFGVPSIFKRPLDITSPQWRYRIPLPVIVTGHDLDLPKNKCTIGIFPIRLLDGHVSYDIGRYGEATMYAGGVLEQCVYAGRGGHVGFGYNKRLGIVLYEPGSDWDLNVKDAQASGEDPYIDEDASTISLLIPSSAFNGTIGTAGALRHSSLVAGS